MRYIKVVYQLYDKKYYLVAFLSFTFENDCRTWSLDLREKMSKKVNVYFSINFVSFSSGEKKWNKRKTKKQCGRERVGPEWVAVNTRNVASVRVYTIIIFVDTRRCCSESRHCRLVRISVLRERVPWPGRRWHIVRTRRPRAQRRSPDHSRSYYYWLLL
jgi:hypothetical protein